ncbi:MAG: hypothetical protein ACREH6_04630, partial [Geminicoccaceae bacterium]
MARPSRAAWLGRIVRRRGSATGQPGDRAARTSDEMPRRTAALCAPAETFLLVAYPALLASAYLIRDLDLLRHVFYGLALVAVALVLRVDDYRSLIRSSVGSLVLMYLGYYWLSVFWSAQGAAAIWGFTLRGLG